MLLPTGNPGKGFPALLVRQEPLLLLQAKQDYGILPLAIFSRLPQQLKGTEIKLYKEMLPETPSISAFLSTQLTPGDAVGIDGKMFSAEEVERMQAELQKCQIKVKSISDPLDKLWTDRTPMPEVCLYFNETQYAGKSSTSKDCHLFEKNLKKWNAKGIRSYPL